MSDDQRDSHDYTTLEPDDILDQDMTCADLVFVLQHLRFYQGGFGSLKIDREVRDYLVSALRRVHGPA